jgi:DNA processing protein
MEDVILYLTCKYFGDWERIYHALENQEDINFDEVEILKEKYKDSYITVVSEDYPFELKQIERPPFVLFLRGNKDLLKTKNKIWYFGTYYDQEFEESSSKHFKEENKELILVSGYSSDFERSLLNNVKPKNSIIVKDAGINSYVNMSKLEQEYFEKNNLVVSEYPDKVIPAFSTWVDSNRIKIGLTKGIFLLSTLKERMTFKIISDTIEEKRDVYCFNEKIDDKSHNEILISKGAIGIKSLKKIFNH